MTHRNLRITAHCLLAVIVALLLVTCSRHFPSMEAGTIGQSLRTFSSNGEQIYFSSTSDRGTSITYRGWSPSDGMMGRDGMMDSGGMMNGNSGELTCAACHGSQGRGGVYTLMGMKPVEAPDIRWSALQDEFDLETFRLAMTQGQDPNGTQLDLDMPRWQMSNDDLADLLAYLKTLP